MRVEAQVPYKVSTDITGVLRGSLVPTGDLSINLLCTSPVVELGYGCDSLMRVEVLA